MTTKRTPGPWTQGDGYNTHATSVFGSNGHRLAQATSPADADHIVRCVNAHDDLLAALRDLIGSVERGDPIGPAKRAALIAIAKAEGR